LTFYKIWKAINVGSPDICLWLLSEGANTENINDIGISVASLAAACSFLVLK